MSKQVVPTAITDLYALAKHTYFASQFSRLYIGKVLLRNQPSKPIGVHNKIFEGKRSSNEKKFISGMVMLG
jgi:hypothetical protein